MGCCAVCFSHGNGMLSVSPCVFQSWHVTFARDLVQMDSIDQQLSAKIALINEHKRRRDMLMSFSKAPADFINGIVASQVSDSHMGQLIH